jgi:hypothetical protein
MACIAATARASLKSTTSRPQRRNVVTVKATYMEFSNQAANGPRAVQAQSGHSGVAPLQLQVPAKEEASNGIVAWIAQIIAGPTQAEREPW